MILVIKLLKQPTLSCAGAFFVYSSVCHYYLTNQAIHNAGNCGFTSAKIGAAIDSVTITRMFGIQSGVFMNRITGVRAAKSVHSLLDTTKQDLQMNGHRITTLPTWAPGMRRH